MTNQENLLDKYYRGETSLEEEKELMELLASEENQGADEDLFAYFENEAAIPDDLEESLFNGVLEKQEKRKTRRMRWYSFSSAAAVVLVLLSVYIDFRKEQKREMENQFFVMEQALYQLSSSLQPEEQQDMLVLWVDKDVEIILN
ncbi:hypothetical protein [Maribellus sediminis]|uniref:hypothetical protein n=1 Tax=Maribellus sediminis TaxID=2696285 RepID=UPI001431AC8C|nr:hypothetical protein [Maribellus sediminis]